MAIFVKKNMGSAERPRLAVFRSNKAIYAQAINDEKGTTVFSYDSRSIKDKKTPVEKAKLVGIEIAKLAKSKKITKVVFDRSSYRYHGQVKALAEGAREGGLEL